MVLRSCRTLAETIELLEKQIQCAFCQETYRDPKILTCFHTFCQGCIQQLLLRQQKDQEVECPQCHSVVAVTGNDSSSLPTVFFINGLVEVCDILKKAQSDEIACQSCACFSHTKATSFCHNCRFVCAACANRHKTNNALAGHNIVPISEIKKQQVLIQLPTKTLTSTCQKHKRIVTLYCFECEKLICQDCTTGDHAGHRYDFVKEVAGAFREEVQSSLVPLRNTHVSVTTAISSIESTKKSIEEQGLDVAKTITNSFEEHHAALNKHEQFLLKQVQEEVGRKVDALDSQQNDLRLARTRLDSLMGFVENASNEEFISMMQQVTSQVKEICEKYRSLELTPAELVNIKTVMPRANILHEHSWKQCAVYSSVVDSSRCHISGPGLKSATTKQVSRFTVHTHDTHGQPTPTKQHVSAKLESLVDGSIHHATVMSQTLSTYELSYTPTIRGRHQLTVQVNNTDIATFQVFVQHPPTQLGTPVKVIEGVKPLFIAVDDNGELFVTEEYHNRYRVLDAQGKAVLTVGSKGKPPFEAEVGPTGIATDGRGNVYIASAHKVQKFNRFGEVIKSTGRKGENDGEFNLPWGIRYHNHQVYVCDSYNGRVQVFDSNLDHIQSFGTHGDGPGQLNDPRDIDFDCQGNCYVVDYKKDQILVFNEDGQYLHPFDQGRQGKSKLKDPEGICVCGGYVYVTEWRNNRVSVFRTSGEFIYSFEKKGSELHNPFGIAVDQDGFVFVCDTGNSRIQVF